MTDPSTNRDLRLAPRDIYTRRPMSETYTSGTWVVKRGEEEAFVQEWTAFVRWASRMAGSGTFRLVRDRITRATT